MRILPWLLWLQWYSCYTFLYSINSARYQQNPTTAKMEGRKIWEPNKILIKDGNKIPWESMYSNKDNAYNPSEWLVKKEKYIKKGGSRCMFLHFSIDSKCDMWLELKNTFIRMILNKHCPKIYSDKIWKQIVRELSLILQIYL